MKSCLNRVMVLSVVVLTALAGCAPHQQYRTSYDPCDNATVQISPASESHAIYNLPTEHGASYSLGFVEFDDQGHLWDRKQMWSVLDWLTAEVARKDLLIVVFIHGWKHSAAPQDKNIDTFRQVLAKLSEDEKEISRDRRAGRQVVGIYLGWRGGSIPVPWLENVTFWDRKNTAEKVGHGDVTEVLSRLEQLKRDKDSISNGNSGTRLVVVGHSFGGLVAHTALSQMMGNRFVHTAGPAGVQSNIEGFGNLVVLINPAFEAQQFASLSDMAANRGSYFPSQVPVLAILTSEADSATRYAFPAGRTVSTLFERTRDSVRTNAATHQEETVSESRANVTAVGHFEPFRTHRLYPDATAPSGPAADLSTAKNVQAAITAANGWHRDTSGSKIVFGDLILERTTTSAARNPYLVVRVDKSLIANHNDIDDVRMIHFLKQLVMISTLPNSDKEILYSTFGLPQVTQ